MSNESLTLYKLMILYMLNNLNFPLTNSQLSEFFVGKEFTSYFQVQQAINELVDTEFIRPEVIRNTTSYYMTPSGESALSMFGSQISKSIKKDILDYFEEQKYELRRQAELTADYFVLNNGEYMVKTTIKEKGNILLELGLNVVSKEQAINVCDQWNKKCEQVYQTLIQELLLTGEEKKEEEEISPESEDAEDISDPEE